MWIKDQTEQHIKTAKILDRIKDQTFEFIKKNKEKNISEKDVQKFIIEKFKENKIKSDKDLPIVAFNQNSAIPHYFPKKKSKILKKNTLILIDIWAKFKNRSSPFADITWMAYYGKTLPKEIQRVFNIVIQIRNKTVKFIKKYSKTNQKIPCKEIAKIALDILKKNKLDKKMNHYIDHSLGFNNPHGKEGAIGKKDDFLLTNLGYTIEPGIYLKNKFGVRSEIDFYITRKRMLIITTPVQKNIFHIF